MKIASGWYQRDLGNALGFLVGALVGGAFASVAGEAICVSPIRAPPSESSRISTFPPTAPYCAGATTVTTTSEIPVRSSCFITMP